MSQTPPQSPPGWVFPGIGPMNLAPPITFSKGHDEAEVSIILAVGGHEVMAFRPSGEIFVRGEKVDSNRQVYEAFREWLASTASGGAIPA
jgi:hypothetical protein